MRETEWDRKRKVEEEKLFDLSATSAWKMKNGKRKQEEEEEESLTWNMSGWWMDFLTSYITKIQISEEKEEKMKLNRSERSTMCGRKTVYPDLSNFIKSLILRKNLRGGYLKESERPRSRKGVVITGNPRSLVDIHVKPQIYSKKLMASIHSISVNFKVWYKMA